MNLAHRWICRSAFWKNEVETHIIPWALANVELGTKVLEVGPGPGATTNVLQKRVANLTCLEIDPRYAAAIGGNRVSVTCGDGTAMPLADDRFDSVLCFTMLHHLGSAKLQDELLAEAARVLRPGGMFAGVDSLSSRAFRLLHLGDTLVAVDPVTFPDRLKAAGFENIEIEVARRAFRFRAWKRLSALPTVRDAAK